MESLFLLIPLSIVLVLLIGAVLAWAVLSGQFDDLEDEGRRILDAEDSADPRPPFRGPDRGADRPANRRVDRRLDSDTRLASIDADQKRSAIR